MIRHEPTLAHGHNAKSGMFPWYPNKAAVDDASSSGVSVAVDATAGRRARYASGTGRGSSPQQRKHVTHCTNPAHAPVAGRVSSGRRMLVFGVVDTTAEESAVASPVASLLEALAVPRLRVSPVHAPQHALVAYVNRFRAFLMTGAQNVEQHRQQKQMAKMTNEITNAMGQNTSNPVAVAMPHARVSACCFKRLRV